MNIPDKISIHSRLFLIILVTTLAGFIITLFIFHSKSTYSNLTQKQILFEHSQSGSGTIITLLHEYLDSIEQRENSSINAPEIIVRELQHLQMGTETLLAEEFFSEDSVLFVELNKLTIYTSDLIASINLADTLQDENYTESVRKEIKRIQNQQAHINSIIQNFTREKASQTVTTLLILVFVFLSMIAFILIAFYLVDRSNMNSLKRFTREIAIGTRPGKLKLLFNSEYEEISENLNTFLNKFDEKTKCLDLLIDGKNPESFLTDKTDILGNKIKLVASRFKEIQELEASRQKDENKRTWRNEGLTYFAEILRSERENVQELSFMIVQKIVMYLDVLMGSLYLVTENEDQPELETIATYAYDRRKYIKKTFAFGEGLPGTCALEKEKIYINDIPEDYADVISGIGFSKPKVILLVPLKIEEEIFGILEIASFNKLQEHELQFIDELANSIALTLSAVKTNQKNARQLEKSKEQLSELHQKEIELQQEVNILQEQKNELVKKETDLSARLTSLNNFSLFAEFNTAGRYINISQKFLDLMELSNDLVLGKHHYEFTTTDRYSSAYKEFWSDLKKGISRTTEEEYELLGGNTFILKEIFAPVMNSEGKVNRIINIACDISELRAETEYNKLQLKEKSIRQNEMENIINAVDSSMVKCELDKEGIISDINAAFEDASGYSRKELLGLPYNSFLKEKESELFNSIWEGILKNRPYTGVLRRTKPTFEENWMMTSFTPYQNQDGELDKVLILAFDITEKKLKYQLLEEANKEIERLKQELNK